MTQRFKANDATELAVINCALPELTTLGTARDTFLAGADTCFLLGGVLFDLGRDPMVGVITRASYIQSFFAIHTLFTRPGTFEFYIAVFRAIWGNAVAITFTVPSPGVLNINVGAITIANFNFSARRIDPVTNTYVIDNVKTRAGENLMLRSAVGTKSQSEVNALIAELSPVGVIVNATLVL